MTSPTKPEVGYITYCKVVRGGPRRGQHTENLIKCRRVVFENTSRETYIHKDRHTDALIATPHPYRRRSNYRSSTIVILRYKMHETVIQKLH